MSLSNYKNTLDGSTKQTVYSTILCRENEEGDPNYYEQKMKISFSSLMKNDFNIAIQNIDFLLKYFHLVSLELQNYLIRNGLIMRLLYFSNLDQQDLYTNNILQFIKHILSLNLDIDNDFLDLVFSCLGLFSKFMNNFPASAENMCLLLQCMKSLVNSECVHLYSQEFFNQLSQIFNYSSNLAIQISIFYEDITKYIEINEETQFYLNYLEFLFDNIDDSFSPYLYSSLYNLVYNNHEFFNHNFEWIYSQLTKSILYNDYSQFFAFKTVCKLDSIIPSFLTEPKIFNKVIEILKSYEHDHRIIPVFECLIRFLEIDSSNYLSHYILSNQHQGIIVDLLKHTIESPYNVKIVSSFLFIKSMIASPNFFIKGFLNIELNDIDVKYSLLNEKEAIKAIIEINEVNLTIELLKGLNALCEVCFKNGNIHDFIETLEKSEIIHQIMNTLTCDENELISNATKGLLNRLYPNCED
ncbi:hypothetical protein TRFO_12085 [Tritrichomonas foetus]|uniref:Uncharacterized protein n=1 Tax=Tritrichomonas foetus TaxID=1144522 RepID=A0A1J4J0X6_9EUKA|nr:hypothetical protein TRFO_12085 [Tritrichomonas foetus]|eukprot:OHS93066.1 hypothetical protein TRFO_12085 [Tritrichomonas foetus]